MRGGGACRWWRERSSETRSLRSAWDWDNCTHLTHTSKVMPQILQARLQQYVNWELPDVQAGFRKGRGTRDQVANICWIIKQENSRKTSTSALLTMPKPLTVWITTNCGKFLKKWEYQTTLPASWDICMQVKKQQFELDMEKKRTEHGTTDWFQIRKVVHQGCILSCHPAYLTSMQSTSCEKPGWMKQKLASRLPGEISITSDTQMTPPLWQKAKEN